MRSHLYILTIQLDELVTVMSWVSVEQTKRMTNLVRSCSYLQRCIIYDDYTIVFSTLMHVF